MRITGRTRLTAVVVGGALALTGVACGGNDDSGGQGTQGAKKGPVTLRLLESTTNQKSTEAVVADFERANPNIKIQTQFVSSDDMERLLLTQLQAGNAPDIFRIQMGNAILGAWTLGGAGRLLDLTGSEWESRMYPPDKDVYTFKGKTYGWPTLVQVFGVLYNTELFDKLGLKVPTQMSEVLDMCRQIKAKGKIPFVQGWSEVATANVWYPQRAAQYVYSVDPDWDDKRAANQVKFATSPGWQAAMKSIVDMKDADCFQPGTQGAKRDQSYASFAKGDAVMTMIAAAQLPAITALNKDLKYAIFNLPGDDPANSRVYASSPTGAGGNAATKHPEEVKKYIDFLSQDATSAKYAEVGGGISPANAVKGELPDYMSENLKAFFTDKKTVGGFYSNWPSTRVAEEGTAGGMIGLITGQKTVKQVLENTDRLWDSAG
jgi:raffinose/stachyose/melibiose transport system substrate-binding protein